MRILGIDPGTALTGYAVIDTREAGVVPHIHEVSTIKTSKDSQMQFRLKSLHEQLLEISDRLRPDVMVIERLFFNTNVKTAMTVGQARGVPLLVAATYSMDVYEYTALQAKRVLTGYGRADKKQMQEAVKTYFDLPSIIKPDDANDALAMILCFLSKDYDKHIKNANTNH